MHRHANTGQRAMNHPSYIAVVIFTLILAACGNSGLSEDDAVRQIRESGGLPVLLWVTINNVEKDSPLGMEVARLVRNGYLKPGSYMEGHQPTDKGKELVHGAVWSNANKGYWEVFEPITHIADVSKVIDMRVSEKDGVTDVEFELSYTPTQYFEDLKAIDPASLDKAMSIKNKWRTTGNARFQRWKNGWRIVRPL